MKKMAKMFIPPCFLYFYRYLKSNRNFYGIMGNFSSWEDAENYLKAHGEGDYSKPEIAEQVLQSIQAVRRGKAVFERDGVLFDKADYNYPILATLFRTILRCRLDKDKVNVLDFGGSLGSTFFQNREYLSDLMPFEWHICEQPLFVEIGKEEIPEIKFHKNIKDYVDEGYSCDILLLSGVIQYFDNPRQWLADLLEYPFKYVIIDRAFFNTEPKDRLGIQYVPPSIYDACYPVWLLNKEDICTQIKNAGYDLVDEWESFDKMPVKNGMFSETVVTSEGMFFERAET